MQPLGSRSSLISCCSCLTFQPLLSRPLRAGARSPSSCSATSKGVVNQSASAEASPSRLGSVGIRLTACWLPRFHFSLTVLGINGGRREAASHFSGPLAATLRCAAFFVVSLQVHSKCLLPLGRAPPPLQQLCYRVSRECRHKANGLLAPTTYRRPRCQVRGVLRHLGGSSSRPSLAASAFL